MACPVCDKAWEIAVQIVKNAALALDRFGNALLLGDPNETISQRLGRAELKGNMAVRVIAMGICKVLGVITREPQHCQWANDPTRPSIGREIWHWSPKKDS